MESLADNRLYAGDRNIDHVSTSQKKKKGKGKKKKGKKREKEGIGEGRQPPEVPSCAQVMG
jgi:hypothetical protein